MNLIIKADELIFIKQLVDSKGDIEREWELISEFWVKRIQWK